MTFNFREDNRELLSVVDNATAGSTAYPPGGRWGPRIQPNLQFVLVHTGHVTIHVDNEILFVPAGYVALLHPNHHEDFYFAKHMETWHRWIHIELNDMNPSTVQRLEHLPKLIPLSDTMNYLTDTLESFSHSSFQDNQIGLRCALAVAMIMLYQTEGQNGWLEKGKHAAVIRAKSEIHKRYKDLLILDDLAVLCNVSVEYLIRLFRQFEGVTPMRYLWKVRIEHAIDLLLSTGLTVGEIGERTGFKSLYHLSRMVKQSTGQTPTEIRRNGRNVNKE